MDPIYFSLFCGLSALLYGVIISKTILAMPPGDSKMQEISRAIQEGAQAYLTRQYLTISFVGFIIFFFYFIFLISKYLSAISLELYYLVRQVLLECKYQLDQMLERQNLQNIA